ncbi:MULTISPECIES: type VI secretion system ATPase TssH [unclassified Leisingera]|uniref:type VI secretion system ATPase TssH n=1 Tax=unclassified Leisingera TaxID=2614906 RepID=UPI0010123296|nr:MULTISPECIES: type VI secretion system ATPase TssH [unclassified Leisingera]MCF6429950.1 type VI secretion system ATPase TssH [Leisingera sp. MMG026]QAX32009.1 type VI secretion system ATPase TssH [Leisingera sp. NJS204]
MTEISRVALFGKLNKLGYQAVESATVFCKMRGNPYVELVHWLHQLLAQQDSDIHRIIQHYDLDAGKIATELTRALDMLPRGASTISDLSDHLMDAMERGWVWGSLLYSAGQVRSGHLLLGMLKTPALRNILSNMSPELAGIGADDLADNFNDATDGSPEERMGAQDGSNVTGGGAEPGEASGSMAPGAMGKGEALEQFCTDLTEQARNGEIDPIVGRDEEIRQIVDILMRRRQNNPILTGEAGVGKTAVVEGFALRIARGDVPPALQDVRLLVLDVGLLQAGASMKGEFENRLRQVIDEVQASPVPIVMFVDETHTLVGAGGAAGTGDAANLLKPALARGTLRTIGATTWAEYKKYIEKDPALTRRFQVVKVDEPGIQKAILMMRGIASMLENHHRVQVLDEGIEAAVSLSARYIPARQLPDKSVSLLDTACARVAVSQHAVPAEVDDSQRRIEALTTELEIIGRDETAGYEVADRRAAAEAAKAAEEERLAGLTERWDKEKAVVEGILDLRAKLREGAAPVDTAPDTGEDGAEGAADSPLSDEDRAELMQQLKDKNAELETLQGDSALILPIVDHQAVASVVGDWTGIPVGRMVKDEIETILNLEEHLAKRVIGQDHAMKMIAKRIQTSRAGLDNPNKPIGVFMLAGTSGVGKTETALALAEVLYGGEQNVITINMSEYQEAHTVSSLKGAPPGYVGYGEGGVLTEAVRRKPYSVVLLDEVEKAHPDVHEIFFQVFDKGVMEDGEGRIIDFKNTLILLTSNVGTETIMDLCSDPDLMPEPEGMAKALRDPLVKVFPPALLGRLVAIPYYPLSPEMIGEITKLQLGRIQKRVQESHGVPFEYSDAVVEEIVNRCQELDSGGRMIDAIVTNTMLPDISNEFLRRLMEGKDVEKVAIGVTDGEFSYAFD